MTHTGTGLGDNTRTWLVAIFAVFNSISASIIALPSATGIPPAIPIILTIVGNAVIVFMTQMGIRDSTSARIAKEVAPTSDNARDASGSVA